MSPQDHNRTIIILLLLIAIFPTLLLCASPWIIAKNVSIVPSPRRDEQILTAAICLVVVLSLALLLWFTIIGLYRRKFWGRKLALFMCIPLLFYCPPVSVYAWWFLHSEGGKKLYGLT
jgi:ABC-type Fe3+ transport system permease subunit